ncbi:MAG: MMPL family transporter [Myxococcota bacterium]
MTTAIERALCGIAAGLVDFSVRRRVGVLLVAAAVTVAAGWLAATGLELDSDPDSMTSPELPFRRTQAELETAFPQLVDNLVVLVEAETGRDARAAAESLADRLRADQEHFTAVFLPGEGPFYREHGLLYLDPGALEELGARLERAGPLLTALEARPELSTFLFALAHLENQGGGLATLGDEGLLLVDEVTSATGVFLDGGGEPIAWDQIWSDLVGAPPDRRQILLLQPARDFAAFGPALDAIAAVRAFGPELERSHGARVRVTGDVAVLTEELSMAGGQILVAASVSLVLVALLLFACFGARLSLATVLTLLVGLVWTAGFAALAVGRLNALTVAFAVLYIGLGIDFGLHFAVGYRERRAAGAAPAGALVATGRGVGSSLVFCALTTAIGFFAFASTDYTGVAELGLISGTGMFLSLLATLSVLPALVAAGLDAGPNARPPWLDRVRWRLPRFPLRAPRRVVAGALGAAVLGALAVPSIRFETDPLDVRDPRVESVQAMRELLSGSERAPWTAQALAADGVQARRLIAELEALPEVRRAYSANELLPAEAARKTRLLADMAEGLQSEAPADLGELAMGIDPAEALRVAIHQLELAVELRAELAAPGEAVGPAPAVTRLLETLGELADRLAAAPQQVDVAGLDAQLFGGLTDVLPGLRRGLRAEPPTQSDLPPAVLERWIARDGRMRIEIFPAEDLSVPGSLERFADAVRRVHPEAGGAVVGTVEFARAIVGALREALRNALVVITALLILLWRSPRFAIFTLSPLLLGALVTAALTPALGMHFNFANVIVLPLVLGIGVDSGIHLVHRHRSRPPGAADVLQTGTARAVLLSALTSIASFTTLAFASHQGIASLAQLLVLGVGAVLVANLIVLPAFLAWAERAPAPAARGSEEKAPEAERPASA